MSRELKMGLAGALCFHLLLFFGFPSFGFPTYEVTLSHSSLEVSLVAPRPERIELPEEAKQNMSEEEVLRVKAEHVSQKKSPPLQNDLRGAFSEAIPIESYNKPPHYPRRARRLGHEGRVEVRVFVTRRGVVERLEVLKSSGHHALDQAALQAIRRWRFEPSTMLEEPVAGSVDIPVVFRLRN